MRPTEMAPFARASSAYGTRVFVKLRDAPPPETLAECELRVHDIKSHLTSTPVALFNLPIESARIAARYVRSFEIELWVDDCKAANLLRLRVPLTIGVLAPNGQRWLYHGEMTSYTPWSGPNGTLMKCTIVGDDRYTLMLGPEKPPPDHARAMLEPIWTTRSGRRIPVADLEPGHARAILRMILIKLRQRRKARAGARIAIRSAGHFYSGGEKYSIVSEAGWAHIRKALLG